MINEITSSYDNNNVNIIITNDPYFENINVTIPRSAEIVHSITNVVDNAFKFASSQIDINLISEEDIIIIEVADDGPGFAPDIFPFLG